jgi:NAD(P)H dehydrogenase (quinone)
VTAIGITGAGGRLGRLVTKSVESLDHAGPDLVLATRRPAEVAGPTRDARFADFDQPESLASAFAGVERLLLISTDSVGNRVRQHSDALAAAADAGVRKVIYTSMLEPLETHPSQILAREHRETEAAVRDSGLEWTILRYGFFTEALVGTGERAIEGGNLVSNAGSGGASWLSVADAAAVAARLLVDGGQGERVCEVAGRESVSYRDVVALLTDISGHAIKLVDVDDETYRDGLLKRGVSQADADEYTSFGVAIREGYASKTSNIVEEITGRPARSVGDVLAVLDVPREPVQ